MEHGEDMAHACSKLGVPVVTGRMDGDLGPVVLTSAKRYDSAGAPVGRLKIARNSRWFLKICQKFIY